MNDESIRTKEKEIDVNGWQVRLYKWSTGKEPRFVGYCPFFWSTLFLVLISPITLTGRAFEWIGGLVTQLFQKEQQVREEKEPRYRQPSNETYLTIYALAEKLGRPLNLDDLYRSELYYIHDIYGWIKQNPNWQSLYGAIKAEYDENVRISEIREQRRAALAERREQLVNFLRPAFKPLMVASAIGVAYLAYIYILFPLFGYIASNIVTILKAIGAGLLGYIFIIALIFIGKGFCEWLGNRPAKARKLSEEVKKLDTEPGLLGIMVRGLIEGIIFVKEAVVMTYKKECPLIKWSDKTGPIQKIQK